MTLNFAHRGSLTEAPENTIPAFQKAIDSGARAIELDIQLTKDNELIVCHDHKFSRFNKEVKGQIKDYTLEEIKKIDIGASFSTDSKGITLPTLNEVLAICPKNLIINIEIKNIPVIYDGIEEILLHCLWDNERFYNVFISSFDHIALKHIQELTTKIPLGMLFHYRLLNTWEYVKNSGLNITSIHPNHVYVDRSFVKSCKEYGFEVYPYTVNSIERYEELVDFGVDGVFSNNPRIFV
ncbi:glycerophosphodiester phosphodiesterase [Oceanobacillus massiliensis]|uniref:glycerophosphodiester phosphodiesterase n=1 Tax=Oceanobacillus massiliensis TaxID=1465765 RepID=UPI000287E746|nr:glycerophosphodiester phosphodiesterase family protein [Oceanobacillus massiliensis]